MQKQLNAAQRAHVIARVQAYVLQQLQQAIACNDNDARSMHICDAAHNNKALQQYITSSRWDKLHNALMLQDTLPREDVFASIVESEGAAALSLTWDFINS